MVTVPPALQIQAFKIALRVLGKRRRQIGSESPHKFAQMYLAHHLKLPVSPMHTEVLALLPTPGQRSRRLAIAAPRGHAKSTVVTLAYSLWCLLYEHEPFIMIASATKEQAQQHLKHIRDEIENNALIKQDFPEIDPSAQSPRPTPWRAATLQLPNGTMVKAVGVGQQIRGLRHKQHRPSLIIADDLEAPGHVLTEEYRAKHWDWFHGALLKAGDPETNVIVVGTVLHFESTLSRLLDATTSPGWITRRYQAVIKWPQRPELWDEWESIFCERGRFEDATGPDAAHRFVAANYEAMHLGAEVLWPERESLEDLKIMCLREGEAMFESEKQNEPTQSERSVFLAKWIRYWDDEFPTTAALLRHFGSRLEFYGAWDPSLGETSGTGGNASLDYSAIIILAKDPSTDTCYVIEADLLLKPPSDAIERILQHGRTYTIVGFHVEANGFQRQVALELGEAAEAAKLSLWIKWARNKENKRRRITLLEPLVRTGKIRFSRKHKLLVDQIRQFPFAKHDDGPDALEMAYRMADLGPKYIGVWVI